MSETFPESYPYGFAPEGPPTAIVEEARRYHALDMATRLVAARERSSRTMLGTASVASDVLETATRFADYLRGGSDD